MVEYQLYISKRNDRTKGLCYARVINNQTINTEQLSEIIQRNCSIKRSDVKAVLTELVEVMNDQLGDGKVIVLEGLGRFKLGIHTTGAESVSAWNVNDNIQSVFCRFQPERKRLTSGNYKQTFLDEVKFKEQKAYSIDVPDTDNEG